MNPSRLRIALLFGGRSAEHEVSVRSAASIYHAMDKNKYEILPVLITEDGTWHEMPNGLESFEQPIPGPASSLLVLSQNPGDHGFHRINECNWEHIPTDVVFPVLHGTYGEDGTIQGLFDLAEIPYVGCGVLASAVGMDKILMKAAFINAGINVGPYFWFTKFDWNTDNKCTMNRFKNSNLPVFVKPANLGSSVGISRVDNAAEFENAVKKALSFDRKILVEDGIIGRELEVSVLGNDDPKAALPGEVISHSEFYDYEEKYLKDSAELKIPADLPKSVIEQAQKTAVAAFRAIDGSGLARVDMFLTDKSKLIVNEVNTLPGFTSISMYPKLWEASGLPYDKLIDELILLALERHSAKKEILTVR